MFRPRVIPCLLLKDQGLVKTVKFKNSRYVGDPMNATRIFNKKKADELIFLDISATYEKRLPNFNVLVDIADECFMPLGYGGGIHNLDHAKLVFDIGFEKIVVNTHAVEQIGFITQLADHYGSQAIIASIDVKRNFLGKSYRDY